MFCIFYFYFLVDSKWYIDLTLCTFANDGMSNSDSVIVSIFVIVYF